MCPIIQAANAIPWHDHYADPVSHPTITLYEKYTYVVARHDSFPDLRIIGDASSHLWDALLPWHFKTHSQGVSEPAFSEAGLRFGREQDQGPVLNTISPC